MGTPQSPKSEVGLLECIATLRDYLAETHADELANDHGGDDPETCTYCRAIADAGKLLSRRGFETNDPNRERIEEAQMNEKAFAACLTDVLNGHYDMDETEGVRDAVPYDEAGVLTQNAGLIVRMVDGSEYQITVVRSRGPRS